LRKRRRKEFSNGNLNAQCAADVLQIDVWKDARHRPGLSYFGEDTLRYKARAVKPCFTRRAFEGSCRVAR
jgi:hypothetical protein